MATQDPSIYTLRYNQTSQQLEGAGGTPEWNTLLITNAGPLAVVLTGFSAGAGTVSATDTILSAFNKLAGNQLNAGGTMTGALALSTGASNPATLTLTANGVTSVLSQNSADENLALKHAGFTVFTVDTGSSAISLGHFSLSGASQPISTNATLAAGGGADATAVLTATSTTQGFLPPRMTTTQKNAISTPTEGLMVYDLTLHAPCVYNGTAWKTVTIA